MNFIMIWLLLWSLNLAGMLLIYSLMAYALARMRWRRGGMIAVLATIILAGLFWIVPAVTELFWRGFYYPNESQEASTGSYLLCFGNWLVSASGIVIFCQRVKEIPRQLADSARLDGCGWFGTHWYVLLPLVRKELVLIALLTLMATVLPLWVPLIWGGYGFIHFFEFFLLEWAAAAPNVIGMLLLSLVITLPVIVIFFLAKRSLGSPTIQEREVKAR